MFQHENAPVYKVSSIKNWLSQFGVEEFDWPAQSSTLSNMMTMNWNIACEPGLTT